MKRWLASLLAAVCALGLFTACGGKEEGGALSPADIKAAAYDAAGFTEELVQLDDTTLPKSYVSLDVEKVADYQCFVSGSLSTPEEFSVFKAKSKDDVAAVREAVERRLEDQKLAYEDYRPDEMPKLEDAVVLEKGECVILVISPNNGAVRDALAKL